MAITSKVTYSLKPQTVERVAELAGLWNVPKSEVVRRAIEGLTVDPALPKKETPLEVFLRIQKKGGISQRAAAKFNAEVRRQRNSWGEAQR